jgi:hypothetical protein
MRAHRVTIALTLLYLMSALLISKSLLYKVIIPSSRLGGMYFFSRSLPVGQRGQTVNRPHERFHLCVIMIFQSGKIMGSLPIVGVPIVSRIRVVRLHSICIWNLVQSSVRHRICQAGSKWSKGLHLEPLACLPSKTRHISYGVRFSEPTLFSACYHNHYSRSQQWPIPSIGFHM